MPSPSLLSTVLATMVLVGAFTMGSQPGIAAMPPALYRLGLPAAAGAVSVTVSSAELSPDPQDGQMLRLVVRYTIKNISDEPVPAVDFPLIRLLDPSGGTHEPAETRADDPALSAGRLDPGAEVGETATFRVATDHFSSATWLLLVGGPHGPRVTLQ